MAPQPLAADLAEAVPYALERKGETPFTGAIYGGVEGGLTDEGRFLFYASAPQVLPEHEFEQVCPAGSGATEAAAMPLSWAGCGDITACVERR